MTPLVYRFIEDFGNFTQALGMGRVPGQIYAYLFFSSTPRTLDDMKATLGISKGSASMCVRQLETLNAVQHVWIKGDRKDYYVANDYFGQIVRGIVRELVGRRVESLGRLLGEAEQEIGRNGNGNGDAAEREFIRARLQRLRAFERKATIAWSNPIVRRMLK